MKTLRQKLIDEVEVRGLSRNTQETYVGVVYRFSRYFHRSPDQIADGEMRAYLLYLLRQQKLSVGNLIVTVSALRFFYRNVLQRPTKAIETALPRMKKPIRRPHVYSPEQIGKLLQVEGLNEKHRTILMTTYAAGLRVSEVCALRPKHILSERGQIFVEQGKGGRDRYTVLSPKLLEQLRHYWRVYRPAYGWLFPSRAVPDHPLGRQAVELVFYRAMKLAGLPHFGGIHVLRHSFATHLLEGWNTVAGDSAFARS